MEKIFITGNLGKDAELKMIGSRQYAVFSVAVTRRWNDQSGQQQSATTWYEVLKSDPNAKLCPYLLKGTKVAVEGEFRFSVSKGTDKDYYNLSIWASEMEFMTTPVDNEPPAVKAEPRPAPTSRYDDNLPF